MAIRHAVHENRLSDPSAVTAADCTAFTERAGNLGVGRKWRGAWLCRRRRPRWPGSGPCLSSPTTKGGYRPSAAPPRLCDPSERLVTPSCPTLLRPQHEELVGAGFGAPDFALAVGQLPDAG